MFVKREANTPYFADSYDFLRCCGAYISCEDLAHHSVHYSPARDTKLSSYWIIQPAMLLQVSQATIDHCPNSTKILRPRAHKTSIACVDEFRRCRDEDHGP